MVGSVLPMHGRLALPSSRAVKPPSRALIAVVLSLFLAGACGGDDDGSTVAAPASETETESPSELEFDVAVPADACALIPDAAAVSGLVLGEPAAEGAETRKVCTFSGTEGIPLTFAVQSGDRFDDKAAQSAEALGEGEEIDGIGDEALFFFSDEDLPEGVGGLLVGVGDLSIEVTLQGMAEGEMRDASVAIAEHALENL
jgi:hypothetical protein